jgi:hypothetical protein
VTQLLSKKILISLVLFVAICVPGLSISLEATGYGSTKEEALRNAREELAKSIQVTVSGVSQVRITDTGSAKIESYKEDFSESTNLELLGVKVIVDPLQVITKSISEPQFQATVGIDGSQSLHLYFAKLVDLLKIIEDTESSITASLQTKKNILRHQIESYNQFEAYKYLALQLGATIQNIPLPQRTKIGLQIELSDLLEQEEAILSAKKAINEKENIDNDEAVSIQTQLSQVNLQQKQISTNINKPSIEQLRPELNKEISIIKEAAKNHPGIPIHETKAFMPAWEKLIAAYTSWTHLWNPIMTILTEERTFQESELQRVIQQIEERPYRSAELTSGGAIELVKMQREQEIAAQVDKTKQYLEEYELQIIRSYFTPEYIKLYENFLDTLTQFQRTKFETSVQKDNVQLFFDAYDGIRKAWPMVVRMVILNEKATFEHYLSYIGTTGKAPANDLSTDYPTWQSYLDMVDILSSLLAQNPQEILDAKITYTVDPRKGNLTINTLEILRKDTNNIIYDQSVNNKIKLDSESLSFQDAEMEYANNLYERFLQDEKETRRLESPQLYARKGISFHAGFGLTNLDYQDFSRPDLNHTFFVISTADARIATQSVYTGIELELLYPLYAWISSNETFHSPHLSGVLPNNSFQYGLYGIIGFSKPFETRKGVVLPFLDLRLSPINSYGGFSGGLGLGVEYRRQTNTGTMQKTSISYYWKPINPISAYGNSYFLIGIGL